MEHVNTIRDHLMVIVTQSFVVGILIVSIIVCQHSTMILVMSGRIKMIEQMNIFDYIRKPFKITNKIRLIELFGGIGSQAMALRNIGADFEHYRLCEWDKFAVASYNAIHGTNFQPSDITKLRGGDLGITNTDQYTYIMTYSFP